MWWMNVCEHGVWLRKKCSAIFTVRRREKNDKHPKSQFFWLLHGPKRVKSTQKLSASLARPYVDPEHRFTEMASIWRKNNKSPESKRGGKSLRFWCHSKRSCWWFEHTNHKFWTWWNELQLNFSLQMQVAKLKKNGKKQKTERPPLAECKQLSVKGTCVGWTESIWLNSAD